VWRTLRRLVSGTLNTLVLTARRKGEFTGSLDTASLREKLPRCASTAAKS
jgi:hypothetical protein